MGLGESNIELDIKPNGRWQKAEGRRLKMQICSEYKIGGLPLPSALCRQPSANSRSQPAWNLAKNG
jgi:hypothetical protein